ncbi:hypothetical protein BKA66DRAFT_444994 [Pyrenochaeta sp. MPI-SDFR-AT-0127]|nr:hypothetical protein BKA66DRAFT_444994 [Pyrenochaeta sp. MPI-SDFR-AT-0127]
MPQFADLVRYSVLLARANNNDDYENRLINDDRDNNSRNHRRVEIGVIVAIVVAGLAIIGVTVAFIMKRRKRQQKKRARQAEQEITWYGPDDEPQKANGGKAIGLAFGGQEGGFVDGKAKKVAFAQEGEAPPPSYEIVVKPTETK